MFFIQRQLSKNTCGHWTEVLAYFYLKADDAKFTVDWSLFSNPHPTSLI